MSREWTNKYKLIGAINAGMFQADLESNVGYMKNYVHMNNPRIHRTYRSVFAFNPMNADFPPSMIFDTGSLLSKIIQNPTPSPYRTRLLDG
jgi:hypothetical protein